MSFFSRLFGKKLHSRAAQVDLQSDVLQFRGVFEGVRVWHSDEGDGIGLYYFDREPDLPKATSVEAFCRDYQKEAPMIEVSIENINKFPVVRTIAKIPQEPSGMTYVGSYIIPFRDFSYVAKVQCEERGMTGMREAALMAAALGNAEDLDESGIEALMQNLGGDAPEHDAAFPDHPVARCRRALQLIAASIRIGDQLMEEPPFALPQQN